MLKNEMTKHFNWPKVPKTVKHNQTVQDFLKIPIAELPYSPKLQTQYSLTLALNLLQT